MRCKINWIDGSKSEFTCEETSEGDSFISLLNDEDETFADLNISQIKYIEYG